MKQKQGILSFLREGFKYKTRVNNAGGMNCRRKSKVKIVKLKAIFILLMIFLLMPEINLQVTAFAQVKESEVEVNENDIEQPQIEKETVIKEEKEVRYPNKLEAKEPPKDFQSNSNISTNRGIATEVTNAKAKLIENVDNAGKDYPIYHGERTDSKYFTDARQFITFKTKPGKTFHLIINHDETGQNVMLLTEVSKDDLLNIVETKERPKEEVKIEETKTEVETKKEEPKVKKEEKTSARTYIFLGFVVLGAVAVGYYFKIYKKSKESSEDEEEEYDELEDVYESEGSENEINDDDEEKKETLEDDDKHSDEYIEDLAEEAYDEEDE